MASKILGQDLRYTKSGKMQEQKQEPAVASWPFADQRRSIAKTKYKY